MDPPGPNIASHLAEIDYLPFLSDSVDLDNAQRSTDAERAVQDVDTKDDRVAFCETCNGLEPTWPDRLRCSIAAFCLHDLCVVRSERVKQVVDDVSCDRDASTWVFKTKSIREYPWRFGSRAPPRSAPHPCPLEYRSKA